MTYEIWLPILFVFGKPGAVLAQERMYEWHWEMHPMWWWGWGDDGDDVSFLGDLYCRPYCGNSLARR